MPITLHDYTIFSLYNVNYTIKIVYTSAPQACQIPFEWFWFSLTFKG